MNTGIPVESPVRGDSHAGFGGRLAETERPKGRHRAASRPYAATDALDNVRREVWNDARRQGHTQLARELKGARFALWKNAENLTERQQLKLARIQKLNHRLYRAYLLSQQLRQIYRAPADHALVLLQAWLKWARRCRLEPFVKVARRITEQRHMVEAAITNNSLTPPSSRSTPRSGSSPDAGSATTHPGPSSPSRCSRSPASAHPYPAGDTTHGTCRRFVF